MNLVIVTLCFHCRPVVCRTWKLVH